MFYRLDMAWNNITPVLPLTIGAISGTIMVFMLSSFIENKCKMLSKILSYVGKETYIVVAFASAIIMMINQFLTHNIIIKYFSLLFMLLIMCKIKIIINKKLTIKIFSTDI